MSTLDLPQGSERCASCKRPIQALDPLDECWCCPGTPIEFAVTDPVAIERVRSELRDGSPGPLKLADRSKARDGL